MPEYLAPGVFVEEVSFRSKTIEGVPTSTTGLAGMTRWGPVQYGSIDTHLGPSTSEPRLITSFTEFERVYGGLEQLIVDDGAGGAVTRESYLAHAARAFFLNGGKRLYVSRVFASTGANPANWGVSTLARTFRANADTATWWGRWPGQYGNVRLVVRAVRRNNVAFDHNPNAGPGPAFGVQARGLTRGAVVEVSPANATPAADADLDINLLRVVDVDRSDLDPTGLARQRFVDHDGTVQQVPAGSQIKEVVLTVRVEAGTDVVDVYSELATHPAQRRWIGKILQAADPEDEDAIVYLDTDSPDDPSVPADLGRAADLMVALQTAVEGERLTGGNDGGLVTPDMLLGEEADPDDALAKATGLRALGEIDDIAIVALPDGGTFDDLTACEQAADRLIAHAEAKRYRIGIVDAPLGSSMNEVREFRGKFDSTRAALYHPWIEILDPLERPAQGAPPRRVMLPPSGFVAGIYARNDITRGVYKAPANEVVMGLTRFEANINTPRNEVLNPEGINALRFFEGRGSRVWGARTMTSDPEWKYVNVRRLFIYLEHSIDKAMQWAVFEPNNERLWRIVRETVEDFLYLQWLNGALLGNKPEEAYFVRCDRTTMTQNDLDNGRLICLVGVAPTKPAEFVIFRVGQWSADSKI